MTPLVSAFAWLLDVCFRLTTSSTPAVALFSLAVYVITRPLARRAQAAMVRFQHLQPQLRDIAREHADDPGARADATRRVLQGFRMRSLIGPVLVQAPVFAAAWRTLGDLARRTSSGLIAPVHLPRPGALRATIAGHRSVRSLGLDLSRSGWAQLGSGLSAFVPHLALSVGVAAAGILHARLGAGSSAVAVVALVSVAAGAFALLVPGGVAVHVAVTATARLADAVVSRWWEARDTST